MTEGLPVEAPAMLGFAGAQYAAVADQNQKKRVVGLFDWSLGKWFTPPSPPATTGEAGPRPHGSWEIAGTDRLAVFPQWNLYYDTTAQAWGELPPPPKLDESNPLLRYFLPARPGSLVLDGEIWLWSGYGILDYSLKEKRIVWQAKTFSLDEVVPDGPYLWLSFVFSSGAAIHGRPPPLGGTLLLLDRASHRALGAIGPFVAREGLCIGERDLWTASFGGLQRWDRSDMYAALGLPPPALARKMARPFRPAEASIPVSLYDAVLRGDLRRVETLLEKPAVAGTVFGRSKTPAVTVAVWTRNLDLVKLFLKCHPDLEATPEIGIPSVGATPLAAAARQREPAMTRLLLQAGARPDNAALLEAVRNHNADIVKLLFKAGAPLTGAAQLVVGHNDVDMAGLLLALDAPLSADDKSHLKLLADPETVTLEPATAADLHHVCELITASLGKNDARAAALVRYIPPTRASDEEVRQIFISSLGWGKAKVVEALLACGESPDPNPGELIPYARSPLVASFDYPKLMLLLLERGAKPRLIDRADSLFLERAEGARSAPDVLPEILKSYPDLNTKLGYGTLGGTALCAAVGEGHYRISYQFPGNATSREEVIRFLLAKGVPPRAPCRQGCSSLHLAFGWREPALACLLAGSDADLRCRDLAGRTILDAPYLSCGVGGFREALENYRPASDVEKRGQARLLEAIRARPALDDLRRAVNAGDLARVNDLLQRGADLLPPFGEDLEDEAAKPGLVFLAVTHRSRELAETLLAHGCDPNIGEWGVVPSPRRSTGDPFYERQQALVALQSPQGGCRTPLIAAAEVGDLGMVKLLLKHGAYAPVQDQFHRNAAEAAATPEIARFIEENTQVQLRAQELFEAFNCDPTRLQAAFASIARIAKDTPEAFSVRDAAGFHAAQLPIPKLRQKRLPGIHPHMRDSADRPRRLWHDSPSQRRPPRRS